jgi:hypothetical protein
VSSCHVYREAPTRFTSTKVCMLERRHHRARSAMTTPSSSSIVLCLFACCLICFAFRESQVWVLLAARRYRPISFCWHATPKLR